MVAEHLTDLLLLGLLCFLAGCLVGSLLTALFFSPTLRVLLARALLTGVSESSAVGGTRGQRPVLQPVFLPPIKGD